jgi:uncharacterized protein
MQFLISASDYTDAYALERRMAARPNHLVLMQAFKADGHFHFGGALLDEQERMIGSVLVLEFPTRADVDVWLEQEPYIVQKVWEKVTVQPFRLAKV